MALLEIGGRKFAIPLGDAVLGADPGSAIALEGPAVLPRHAIVQSGQDGQVVIRRATPQAVVTINGVRLGAEPTPLLHGDKVQVGEHELTFVDERRAGSTQHVQAMTLGADGAPQPAGSSAASREAQRTANTGGRVVCLTDGREYQIAGATLVFGRDAACDVVVPGRDVSRRHAEITQTPSGYALVDASTNGTFVNEERVVGQRVLARADIVRIGDEQFRFYADPVAAAAPAARASAPAPAARQPVGAAEHLKDTMHGVPVVPVAAGGAAPLASFLVKGGQLKGRRLTVRAPVVNIGRADYNDVVLPDSSVSTAHAKLQRREGLWILVDLDSTNGTEVDGERVRGEAALAPGATVRLGDVTLAFEPGEEAVSVAKGGGTQLMRGADLPAGPPPARAASAPPAPSARGAAPAPAAAPRAPRPAPSRAPAKPARPKRPVAKAPPPKKAKGCGSTAAIVCAAAVGVAYWILV